MPDITRMSVSAASSSLPPTHEPRSPTRNTCTPSVACWHRREPHHLFGGNAQITKPAEETQNASTIVTRSSAAGLPCIPQKWSLCTASLDERVGDEEKSAGNGTLDSYTFATSGRKEEKPHLDNIPPNREHTGPQHHVRPQVARRYVSRSRSHKARA